MLDIESKIYVAGHNGMVGSAIVRHLSQLGCSNLVTRDRAELDLTNQQAVESFFFEETPDIVILAAAKVGGIHANNTYPADFIFDNLSIELNTINSAYRNGAKQLLFLGSSCIYPKMAPQPLKEDCLLTGSLEPTNEAYAIAKIAGLKLCEYYRKQFGVRFHSMMPTNLYGRGDNYHPEHSHLLPALLRRFHEAKLENKNTVTIWGTGTPRRELMNVDDLASAAIHVLQLDNPPDLVNAGTGIDHSILEIAEIVKEVIGFKGEIDTDPSKPDGTPRKLMDISLLESQGWSPSVSLEEGIKDTYQLFLEESERGNLREA